MTTFLALVFVASIAGSLHCAGMCGGIVTLCVSGKPTTSRRDWTPHLSYNFGRAIAYAALGVISGALGAAINIGGDALGWGRAAAMLAGGTMIVVGGVAMLRSTGMRLGCIPLPRFLQRIFQRCMSIVQGLPIGVRPMMIGLLTGLLPCGWLYAFVISAAGTGSPWLGGLTMFVFWAGTLPIMLALGVGVQKFSGSLRRHIPRITAATLVVVGVVTVASRLHVPTFASPTDPSLMCGDDLHEHVRSLDASNMPCCDDDDS